MISTQTVRRSSTLGRSFLLETLGTTGASD
jgi:hypothetical protein